MLTVSWELALRAAGYAANTVRAYQNAVRSLAGWLAEHHPEVGPGELDRQHVRGWLVEVREHHSRNTAEDGSPGSGTSAGGSRARVRPTRTPRPVSGHRLRAIPRRRSCQTPTCVRCSTCTGTDFTARRDTAIIMLFLDGGLRLSELAGLQVADVDLRARIVFVAGKASRRQGGPGAGSLPARAAPAPIRGHAAAMAGQPRPPHP